jgi:hypothetical protein
VAIDTRIPLIARGSRQFPLVPITRRADPASGHVLLCPTGGVGGGKRAKQSQFPERQTGNNSFVVKELGLTRSRGEQYRTNPIRMVEIASSAFGLLAMTDAREGKAVRSVPRCGARPEYAKQSQFPGSLEIAKRSWNRELRENRHRNGGGKTKPIPRRGGGVGLEIPASAGTMEIGIKGKAARRTVFVEEEYRT